jgi:protein phosphatase
VSEAETTLHVLASAVDVGKVRDVNEDHALAEPLPSGHVLLAVADGVGGLGGGDLASAQAVRALLDECRRSSISDPIETLSNAFMVANSMVRLLASERSMKMACTLVAGLVKGNQLWLAHAGDSRAYLLQQGRLQQLTRDHSWVEEQVLAGNMTEEEAETSQFKNVITRGIGVSEEIVPEYKGAVALQKGDVVMLCSDGLYRALPEDGIMAAMRQPNATLMARALIEAANAHGGPDNIGVALMVIATGQAEAA